MIAMHKFLTLLLILGMLIMPHSMMLEASVEYKDIVEDEDKDYDFSLSHDQERVSKFTSTEATTDIQEIGDTLIAVFTVSNNTRDGYSVHLKSETGKLHSASGEEYLDGEKDIPYSVKTKNKIGQIGIGMNHVDTLLDSDELVANKAFIKRTADIQSTPSNFSMELYVNIDASHVDKMVMAGDFIDDLTITYADL